MTCVEWHGNGEENISEGRIDKSWKLMGVWRNEGLFLVCGSVN